MPFIILFYCRENYLVWCLCWLSYVPARGKRQQASSICRILCPWPCCLTEITEIGCLKVGKHRTCNSLGRATLLFRHFFKRDNSSETRAGELVLVTAFMATHSVFLSLSMEIALYTTLKVPSPSFFKNAILFREKGYICKLSMCRCEDVHHGLRSGYFLAPEVNCLLWGVLYLYFCMKVRTGSMIDWSDHLDTSTLKTRYEFHDHHWYYHMFCVAHLHLQNFYLVLCLLV